MSDQSPPKRVTRARATANTGTGIKTARIATAASKATVARSLSTAKRMAPVNDDQDEITAEDIIEPKQQPKPRGRPRKVVAAQPEESDLDEITAEPPKPTRGRPRKTPIEAPAPEPPKPRGRPRKVDTAPAGTIVVGEATKTTRTRTTTVSRAAAPKKSVQFEEPGKENIIPAPSNEKGKQKELATGLRAKPLRKPAVPAARATRSQPKSAAQKSPLSPKKTTQIATGNDDFSDDELAGTGKTPTKALAMSPMKPPAGFTSNAAKKLDFSNSSSINRATTQDMSASVMASPARRPPSSPFKESVKTSPSGPSAGDCLLRSPVKLPMPPSKSTDLGAPAAATLLRSPARRPPSPMKVAENGSPTRSRNNDWTHGATPSLSAFKISKFATPRTLTKGASRAGQILGSNAHRDEPTAIDSPVESKETRDSDPSLSAPKFSGRLSSIFPRDSNPAFSTSEPVAEEMESQLEIEQEEHPIVIDETITVVGAPVEIPTINPSPPKAPTGSFDFREVDENPFQDSDSEDDLGSEPLRYGLPTGLKTPRPNFASSSAPRTPFTAISKTPRTTRSVAKLLDSNVPTGFTPLAKQLDDWMPVTPGQRAPIGAEASPVKNEADNTISVNMTAAAQPSPTKNSYFDDAMSVCDEMQMAEATPEQAIEDDNFSPVELDEEDFALAHEADEMSLLEPGEVANVDSPVDVPAIYEPENAHFAEGTTDEYINSEEQAEEIVVSQQPINIDEHVEVTSTEPAASEASQEYGDENATPIDPVLLALDFQAPSTPKFVTPKRVLSERVFHTVSKVPLKAEAPASPTRPSPAKRSASVSKLPNQRSTNTLSRSNTVISYSPSKKTRSRSPRKAADTTDACVTPSKDNSVDWSTIGTPARTPRRDLNPALLKGAVVFVDVHTTEGADASGLFIELLTQMGARSVKRWDWSGNRDDGSKIGITHVVFKDGGRRTLEKARETGGVISCVGVGWVLE